MSGVWRTQVRFLWRDPDVHRQFRTGVSLHSHTMHSRENLGFIPKYAAAVPLLAWEIRRQSQKYEAKTGRVMDYTRGHWTPPLPSREAFNLEKRHVEEKLGLAALVSLSDHDSIEAGRELRTMESTRDAPLSIEWTVPMGQTYFHIGAHNLPAGDAHSIVAELARYTANPSESLRKEALSRLSGCPETLVVLNHPLWDQGGIGAEAHRALLRDLLGECDGGIHALELNGLRPWNENEALMDLARAREIPLVSGGDRHGCEPSAMVNLTRAASFAEFVCEVREGYSEIAVLDHYRKPRGLRILESVCDIMGYYPELAGRSHWSDRVYCRRFSGAIAPLSGTWLGEPPRVVRCFESLAQLARKRVVRNMLRVCFSDGAGPVMPL
jgi:hypothetical protein